MDIYSGTIDFRTTAGAPINDVIINGNTHFIGGSFFTSANGNPRNLQLGGLLNYFSSASTRTDFGIGVSAMLSVTLLVQPTAVVAAQTMTGNLVTTVWPGNLTVNNTTGLVPAVTFSGGNFRVLGDVTFQAATGKVKIDECYLFVGGQIAPYAGAGNFTNNTGYITSEHGFVSMNGNANQTVSGGGTFENFEVDVYSNSCNITGTFTAKFGLASGTVTGGAAIHLNNATKPPIIIRNTGLFSAAPTFDTDVDVIYIGSDKTAALELTAGNPGTDKLRNLTIATVNGTNVPGQGVVRVDAAVGDFNVKGVLTVNSGQALLLDGVKLYMYGDSIYLNGDIANHNGWPTDYLVLNSSTGTVITGSGLLPDVEVADGSVGNVINGSRGLITQLLGADKLRGGGDDFDPTAFQANARLGFDLGANPDTLRVAFGPGYGRYGTHFGDLYLNDASNVLILDADVVQAGFM
ncbi:MAG: hypothetical protein ACPL1K_03485, partial [Candidatus Kryptoniota bacterium]